MNKLSNFDRKVFFFLVLTTIFKASIVFLFYQHVIVYDETQARIAPGYGWDQLVNSMRHGKYEMNIQSGLSDIYNFTSRSYRPPIYPIFLYISFFATDGSHLLIILLQSIITSMVAFLGYKIIRMSSGGIHRALACIIILFLFPMNFLKSGTIDETPLLLVFLLLFLITFLKFLSNQKKRLFIFFSGVYLGISALIRFTANSVLVLVLPFLLLSKEIKAKRAKNTTIFLYSFFLLLVPWLARNYLVYKKVVLSSGSNRIIFITLSEDFIRSFPHQSIDEIERKYLREFHQSNSYFSKLDELETDKEFLRLALRKIRHSPGILLKSILAKLKVFFPAKYYPAQNDAIRDFVFVFTYYSVLLFFVISFLFGFKRFKAESILLIIIIVATFIPSLLYFMLSRHFYLPMILMIIFSCLNFPLKRLLHG